MSKNVLRLVTSVLAFAMVYPAAAQKKYGPGVTDTEIKIGQTFPYSGPASALSVTAKLEIAYLAMINAKGGVNGRKYTADFARRWFQPTEDRRADP